MDSLPGGSHKESLGESFGVLGVRVPLSHRVSLKVSCGVCRVRVRRSKTGLSHRVSFKVCSSLFSSDVCTAAGLQIKGKKSNTRGWGFTILFPR